MFSSKNTSRTGAFSWWLGNYCLWYTFKHICTLYIQRPPKTKEGHSMELKLYDFRGGRGGWLRVYSTFGPGCWLACIRADTGRWGQRWRRRRTNWRRRRRRGRRRGRVRVRSQVFTWMEEKQAQAQPTTQPTQPLTGSSSRSCLMLMLKAQVHNFTNI